MVNGVKINPEMMKWARKRAGFINGFEEKLPKTIKSKYKSWESGEKYPTWNQLREVSKKYGLPTAFFFRSSPPDFDEETSLINYRKLDNGYYENRSPNLIKNIRKSRIRRNIFLDVCEDLDEDIVCFKKYSGKINKENVVKYIRKILDVDLTNQKENVNDFKHYSVLNFWKEKFYEKLGILIFESKDVEIEEMRALCVFHDRVPIILLNGKDTVNGRIFSLFHELTHLVLGESAICDDDENLKEEVFCNAVAGEFLVPTDDLNKEYGGNVSNNSLKKLAHIYGVSTSVIVRRLLDTHKINNGEYNLIMGKIKENFINIGKGGDYYNNQIKYNGKPYYRLILDAYDAEVITIIDFMNYTNLKKREIPKIQEKIHQEEF